MQLQTDASGTVGYGAYCAGKWLSMAWTTQQLQFSIEFKDLSFENSHVPYPFPLSCLH